MKNTVFEVAWKEIDRKGMIVSKRKAFASAAARDRFAVKVSEKDSFYRFDAFLDY